MECTRTRIRIDCPLASVPPLTEIGSLPRSDQANLSLRHARHDPALVARTHRESEGNAESGATGVARSAAVGGDVFAAWTAQNAVTKQVHVTLIRW